MCVSVSDYSCDWLAALFVEHSLSTAQRTHLYVRQCHVPAPPLPLSLFLFVPHSNPKLSACVYVCVGKCCEFLSLTARFLSCHMSDITSVAHKAALSAAPLLLCLCLTNSCSLLVPLNFPLQMYF